MIVDPMICELCKTRPPKNGRAKFCEECAKRRIRERNNRSAASWRERNPEKRRRIVVESNAKRKQTKAQWHQERTVGSVISRERCCVCGTTDGGLGGLVIHHKDGCNGKRGLPLNNDPTNLVVVCRRCHPKLHSHGNLRQPEEMVSA